MRTVKLWPSLINLMLVRQDQIIAANMSLV